MENIALLLIFGLLPILEINGQKCLTSGQTCEDQADLIVRVVNGENTNAYKAPWHVILELKKRKKDDKIINYCGGSILTPNIILTAAHCFWKNELHFQTKQHLCPIHVRNQETIEQCYKLPGGCPKNCIRVRPEDLNVYVGVTSIRQSVRVPLKVKKIILHPGWDKRSSHANSVKKGNDLALIVLKNKLYFSPKINSICLPSDQFILQDGQNVYVNGFGLVENDRLFGRIHADILQRGDLQFKTNDNCIAEYEKVNKTDVIQGDQICAYSTKTPQTDTCQGDSGSGLVRLVNSIPVLVGVVSFGHRYCKDLPGVYSNIATHMDWIEEQWQDIVNNEASSDNSTTVLETEQSSTISEQFSESIDCEVGEEYENNCYLLVKSPLDWLSASSDCRARNGTLVAIEDSGLNEFIANDISNGVQVWINTNGPVWKWSDGEIIGAFISGPTIETEFIEGEDRSCIFLNFRYPGKWSNDYCGTTLPYVCQGQKLLVGCGGGSHGIPCCPEYMYGDQIGGRQERITFSPKTEAGCQSSCKVQHPTSIGVTQTHDGTRKCYCEFGSPKLGGNANKRKTCLFPTARIVVPYEEIEEKSKGIKPTQTGTGVAGQGFVRVGLPSTGLDDYDFRSVDDDHSWVSVCGQAQCQIGNKCCDLAYNRASNSFECPQYGSC